VQSSATDHDLHDWPAMAGASRKQMTMGGIMQIPEWIKPAAWGAVAGAVAIAIVGFSADWVVTSGTAAEIAEKKSDEAVLAALTPVCVAQFEMESSDAQSTHLAALNAETTWKQGDYIGQHGWATMPGTEKSNDKLAKACANKLLELVAK
jgi:hypothetical protein